MSASADDRHSAREGISLGEDGPLFQVVYADDDPYLFWNGTRMRFGRDDDVCQIPVWEQILGRALSRVAGELWCAHEQMWVRNLSTAHELMVGGDAAVQVLPARVDTDRGFACSIPSPSGTVTSPSTGTWTLEVSRLSPSEDPTTLSGCDDEATVRIDNVPDRHRDAAEALCATLMAGGTAPATYAQIAARQGWTERVARRRVEELCMHYKAQIEALPGGRRPGETLTEAVARTLVARNKLMSPRRRT